LTEDQGSWRWFRPASPGLKPGVSWNPAVPAIGLKRAIEIDEAVAQDPEKPGMLCGAFGSPNAPSAGS